MLKHDPKRAELHFSLTRVPQEIEGVPPLSLENILGTLGDDLEDFFFGCSIRGVQSTPFKNKKKDRPDERDEELENIEHPLKTIEASLELPAGTETVGDKVRPVTKFVKV